MLSPQIETLKLENEQLVAEKKVDAFFLDELRSMNEVCQSIPSFFCSVAIRRTSFLVYFVLFFLLSSSML